MWSRAAIAQLDAFYPPCGPCAFCCSKDKRHRFWDALIDSPDSDETIAWWMTTSLAHVQAVRAIRPYRKGGRMLAADELRRLASEHAVWHEAHEAVQRPIREANARKHRVKGGAIPKAMRQITADVAAVMNERPLRELQ